MIKLSDKTKQVVVKTVREIIGVKCDMCGRLIIPKCHDSNPKVRVCDKDTRYFRVTTGHNDWGNDSIESLQQQELCPECLKKFVAEYIDGCKNTDYLEFVTKHVAKDEYAFEKAEVKKND